MAYMDIHGGFGQGQRHGDFVSSFATYGAPTEIHALKTHISCLNQRFTLAQVVGRQPGPGTNEQEESFEVFKCLGLLSTLVMLRNPTIRTEHRPRVSNTDINGSLTCGLREFSETTMQSTNPKTSKHATWVWKIHGFHTDQQ